MRWAVLGMLLLGNVACTSVRYYGQAISGQLEIWRKRVPIVALLDDPALPQTTRDKLALVVRARDFAASELALPDHGSYRDYVALDREFVVWNVFTAPELQLAPVQSCFLIVGCLDYRGYFSQADAEAYAAAQRAQGYDVHLGGVAAYSTLGWFDDPLLSSMLAWDDLRIVEILFHELAHQRVYVNDDTSFNESFAVAVATAGLERWQRHNGADASTARVALARETALMNLILAARDRLAVVYASGRSPAGKRADKARILGEMTRDYAALKDAWGGYSAYDGWMLAPWNNAKLASVATYNQHVEAFLELLDASGNDFETFFIKVEQLADLPGERRAACLAGYQIGELPVGCP